MYNIPPKQLPSFETLRRNGRNIRLHGNKFIQIDLGPNVRMHVFGDILPRGQIRPSQIHTHDYDFTSYILSGQLVNVLYEHEYENPLNNRRSYRIHTVDRRKGVLVPTNDCFELKVATADVWSVGASYRMHADQIHAAVCIGHAITAIITGSLKRDSPRVYIQDGVAPDNEYRRDSYSEDFLWNCVAEVYGCTVAPQEPDFEHRFRQFDQAVKLD